MMFFSNTDRHNIEEEDHPMRDTSNSLGRHRAIFGMSLLLKRTILGIGRLMPKMAMPAMGVDGIIPMRIG
jgi:hypothetical protein